jgi:DHA1 family bicyclomycin/chloramphenicol resistance-like MFS transporter
MSSNPTLTAGMGAAAAATTPPPRAPIWLLALITFSGTLAMHIFVPALPYVASDLGTTNAAAQLTLSFYIAGLALGQLVYGPVSDHFGRRPVLIVGMAVYAIAGLVALLSPTITTLIGARLLQALGGCAGLVLGRAIVRDQASGEDAARKLSLMNLILMVGPGLAPMLGALMASLSGWRSIFIALCALGVGNLILIWRLLPESGGGRGHDMGSVMRAYRGLVRSRRFLGYAIGGGCATTCIYAYIAAAPFILVNQLHRPPGEVGIWLAVNIAGAWVGSLAASRLVGKVRTRRLMVWGNALSCVSGAVFLAAALGGALTLPLTVVTMFILTFGAGVASPTALSEALSVNPGVAGSASGLYGFAQMGIGALCTGLPGAIGNPAIGAGAVLLGTCLLAQAVFWWAGRTAR